MRHAASRPATTNRRGRAMAAGVSCLIVAVSVLSAIGVIPVPATDTSQAAGESTALAERGQDATARGRNRVDVPEPAPTGSDRGAPSRTTEPTPDARSTQESGTTQDSETPKPSPARAGPVWDRPLPDKSGSGRRVVFSISHQHVWLVRASGELERNYPVSGSRFDQLKPGKYDVIRKRRHTTSYHGTETMEYMVTFTFGENAAIGFHNIPTRMKDRTKIQARDQLGTPLSDGCVRQWQADAKALWKFAPARTPVIVLA